MQLAANWSTLGRMATGLTLRLARRAVDGEAVLDSAPTRFARPLGSARVFEGGFYSRRLIDDMAARVPGATPSFKCTAGDLR